jgi:hypothetical protein
VIYLERPSGVGRCWYWRVDRGSKKGEPAALVGLEEQDSSLFPEAVHALGYRGVLFELGGFGAERVIRDGVHRHRALPRPRHRDLIFDVIDE